MSQKMDDDLEFLLPSELLTDDDILTDFGLSSDLSSPVESVTGTTETGGDEDDFITELTRKLTRSAFSYDHPAKQTLRQTGSPQSTLSGLKTGSIGSPFSDSRVFSPPDVKDSLSWDMLYAAAEEAARIRMMEEAAARIRMVEEAAAFYTSKLFGQARKPNPSAAGFYSGQAQAQAHAHARQSYQQFQASKNLQMKQHKLMMNNGGMSRGNMDYLIQTRMRDGGGGLSVSAWPTLQQSQQQTGAGVKPVYPGEPGPIKERVGTGVFMPRRFGSNPTETRKKPVHGAIDAPHFHPRVAGYSVPNYDAVSKMGHDQGRYHLRPPPLMKQELVLPQEWTY